MPRIPAIIHYIFLVMPEKSPPPFNLVHFLAVKSAAITHQPDTIFFILLTNQLVTGGNKQNHMLRYIMSLPLPRSVGDTFIIPRIQQIYFDYKSCRNMVESILI